MDSIAKDFKRKARSIAEQIKSLKEILNEALSRGLGLSQQQFEVKSRPLRLRPGLVLTRLRLRGLDDGLEVKEFFSKTTRLSKHKG